MVPASKVSVPLTIVTLSAGQTLTNKSFSGVGRATSLLTSAGEVATTSGTSVVLATGLPSWVKSFSIVMSGMSTNGTSPINIQFGTDSNWVTTGYVSGSDNYTSGIAPATSTIGFRIGRSTGAGNTINAIYTIALMGGTNNWVGQLNGILDTGTSLLFGGGTIDLADVTAIRLTTAGGANLFDAGSAVVWYE